MVGCSAERSPHGCSYFIRRAIYRVATSQNTFEYCRHGKRYLAKSWPEKIRFCECLKIKSVADALLRVCKRRNDVDVGMLRQYVLETLLGCRITNAPIHEVFEECCSTYKEIELLLAATIFWKTKTKPPDSLLSAILMGISNCQLRVGQDLLAKFSNSDKNDINEITINRISEWQSCVKYAMLLNKTLSTPLHPPPLSFNCKFLSAFSHGVIQKDSKDFGQGNFLLHSKACDFFS